MMRNRGISNSLEEFSTMIKIRVTDIPARGLSASDRLSLEALNDRMNEAPDNDIQFVEAPEYSIEIRPEKGGAEMTGSVVTRYERPCGVCLTSLTYELSKEVSLTLKAKSSMPGVDRATETGEWEDDVGIIYYNGEHIDLEEILQETLILSISPFNNSHEGCPGLPANAKDEAAEEKKVTLGDLIKNSQVH